MFCHNYYLQLIYRSDDIYVSLRPVTHVDSELRQTFLKMIETNVYMTNKLDFNISLAQRVDICSMYRT